MKPLTLEDIAARISALRDELAHVIGTLKQPPARTYADALEPIAVPASVAARLLSVDRTEIYRMHHSGELNGFRPYPKAHLKFLVSEIREVAQKMSYERRDA